MEQHDTASDTTPDEPVAMRRRVILGSAVGNVVEWFDFAAYGCVASALSVNFFPSTDAFIGLLQTFAVFAVAFALRPVGGLVFGPLGDRIGRRRVLAITVLLIAGSTTLVGVLPTYDQIGIAAPLLLLGARMIQGFSVGGEYAGACAYLLEHAAPGRRGRLVSLMSVSAQCGFALAALITLVVSATTSPAAFTEWGWRIPFLVAAPVGLLGFFIRYRLDETPVFAQLPVIERTPLREVLRHHRRQVLLLTGYVSAAAVAFYTVTTYMTTYLEVVDHTGRTEALLDLVLVLLAGAATAPLLGYLSDRHGRRRVALISAGGLVVVAIPGFVLAGTGVLVVVLLGQLFIVLATTGTQVSTSAVMVELFPARVRFTASALSYNAAFSIFGGTAPFVATGLIYLTGERLAPAYWITAIAVLGVMCMALLPDTGRRSLAEPTRSAARAG